MCVVLGDIVFISPFFNGIKIMKEYSKKFFIFIMCGWLAFSSSYIVYEKSYCYAMEWAGVVAGLDSAFKFMLGLVGVSVGVGVADQVDWGTVRNDCMNFQQNQGNSSVAVSKWWSDICDGALDTASSCWDSFTEWASSLGHATPGNPDYSNCSVSGKKIAMSMTYALSLCGIADSTVYNLSGDYSQVYALAYLSWWGGFRIYKKPGSYTYTRGSVKCNGNANVEMYTCTNKGDTVINSLNNDAIYWEGQDWSDSGHDVVFLNFASVSDITDGSISTTYDFDNTTDIPSETDSSGLQSITKNISNLKIINQGDTTIEGDTVINIPWENVGDNTSAIDEAIQGLIDKVNEGVLSLEELSERLQIVSNTYVYDTTTNNIFPNDDESIEDKINENKSNEGFTLFGLEKFFPFCIPWDLYALLGILEATPQAPQIPVPMPNVKTKQIDTYILDMSPLEPVAVVLRYGFDFMFIVGLALASRRLIGAGGGE